VFEETSRESDCSSCCTFGQARFPFDAGLTAVFFAKGALMKLKDNKAMIIRMLQVFNNHNRSRRGPVFSRSQ
jgi:hypothetical protein